MYICKLNVNQRIERYRGVIEAVEQGRDLQSNHEVDLKDKEKIRMLEALDGDVYDLKPAKRRNYIILRLDRFLSDGGASHKPNVLTIEHVLLQTVAPNSEWKAAWPDDDERDKWVHKIANLVPLSRKRNSQARNYDFNTKKSKYFQGKEGVSSFALTSEVLNESQWTPDVLSRGQKQLMEVFKKNWDLSSTSTFASNDKRHFEDELRSSKSHYRVGCNRSKAKRITP